MKPIPLRILAAGLLFLEAAPRATAPAAEPVMAGSLGRSAATRLAPAPDSVVAGSLGRSAAVRAVLSLPGDTIVPPVRSGSPAMPASLRWRASDGRAGPVLRGDPQHGYRVPVPRAPGRYTLELDTGDGFRPVTALDLFVQVPASEVLDGRLRGYVVGQWPAGTGRYAPPRAFIEVTESNRDVRVSEHFRLRDFLTHDQPEVWPKFVVLDTLLLDKLELVMDELAAAGHPAGPMHVMSGFRTPRYNGRGLDQGRSALSRHLYGDAADVWVDADGDGMMDDLDGNGRTGISDARVLAGIAARIEARYPELAGGIGVYAANAAHGPFVHIDARGTKARW